MQNLDATLSRVLDDLAQTGRRRSLRVVEHLSGGRVLKDGRELLNFSSNDYLGLTHHPLLIERAREWAAKYGAGSGASRLVTGHNRALEAVEEKIAAAKGVEAAVVMASGWQCNASVLPALLDRTVWGAEPLVFADRLNHASLHMGCQSAGVKQTRFRHNDLTHLKELLDRTGRGEGPRFIVTESVFSMDGDAPDVDQLVAIAEEWDAFLYLDEAHATGVLGSNGFGLSVGTHVDLAMGTFSKAMGGFGAYVAGSQALKDFLVNRASGLIYATALPPAVLGAMDAAIDLVPTLTSHRARLQAMAQRLRLRLNDAGLDTGHSTTQIVPVILGDEDRTLKVAARLEELGFLGIAIRPPTVPPGSSRIRFALSAGHAEEDVERLADAIIIAAGTIA
ncbi:aminotransferase class I/II-fold pyridoxal phosphate-dependent enzyme [Magnetospirillum gryphiswaldense]|nr:aminotransferase class I/II-fold pyridoxal phosphate-dependent enzyme [Magnetospirillum gryphiswaldense]AVM73818.1 8-amino-7-oxononanoate synthase [Magnetospirillum gryphiswaldense MSR-1]AVM77721.1 8-amino-7-oxononanoate synthase [Magnetospirillum gryphiswaldense]